MNQTTYVSSERNDIKQSKLNNVIKSLSDFVSCTTNDCTVQDYGEINYDGEITIGQVIKGTKRPRRANVPVISQNNVFLGYLDGAGNLTVRNNLQTLNTASEGHSSMTYLKSIMNTTTTEVDTCTNIRCSCCVCPVNSRNSLITRTYWDIQDCRIIACNMYQCIYMIYRSSACVGYGETSFCWGGDNSLCVYANNNIHIGSSVYSWNNPNPIVILDTSTYDLLYCPTNKEFIDCCLNETCGSNYCSSINSNGNGVTWSGTIYTELKNTVEYATTSYVRIREKYV